MSRYLFSRRAALALALLVAFTFPVAADSTLARPVSNAGPVFGITTGPGEVIVADAGQGIVRLRHTKTELVAALPGVTDVDVIEVTHSWTRDGVPAIVGSLEKRAFPWVASRLQAGHIVAAGRLDDLPDTAQTDRRNMTALGIARYNDAASLEAAGADLVVTSLGEVAVDELAKGRLCRRAI